MYVCAGVHVSACVFTCVRVWGGQESASSVSPVPCLMTETGTSLEHRGHSFGKSKKSACSRGPFALPGLQMGTTLVGSYLHRF